MKFENDYELYYKNSSADILDNIKDVEAAFEALHQQVETEYQLQYATRKFDKSVPQHFLLDSSIAKNKCKLNHRKSFKEKQMENVDKEVKDESSKSKFSKEDIPTKLKVNAPSMSTNAKREFSNPKCDIKAANDFFHLGHEPEVNKKFSNPNPPQNEYEDVRVFQKRTKKKKMNQAEVNPFIENKAKEEIKPCNELDDNELIIPLTKPVPKETKQCMKVSNNNGTSTKSVIGESKGDMKIKANESKDKKPFESFQNFLFSIFTSCVPWYCMRRVYWRQNSKVGNFNTSFVTSNFWFSE